MSTRMRKGFRYKQQEYNSVDEAIINNDFITAYNLFINRGYPWIWWNENANENANSNMERTAYEYLSRLLNEQASLDQIAFMVKLTLDSGM